ncbi:hypothetical protein NDU88_003189 [Pleurodeles waltl]|uniref:Uncharacterized protein n=1 Tax=Pleurodeles waltl TaxID=8319 RepID=A0AAV7RC69_PLEWA|nr:hypothetical protein NDU88_003189 [Pleurodeles waltl]
MPGLVGLVAAGARKMGECRVGEREQRRARQPLEEDILLYPAQPVRYLGKERDPGGRRRELPGALWTQIGGLERQPDCRHCCREEDRAQPGSKSRKAARCIEM